MDPLDRILGKSAPIVSLRDMLRKLLAQAGRSQRHPPILIQGETGTGKGLVAGLLHRLGPRAQAPFVDVNCAAIPETLLEAELFGYERGAFTDAKRAKRGLFQAASPGVLFLDEVGLLPESLQAKLLRALEDRAVRPLGSTRSEPVDVWILSATNSDLGVAVRERRFRADLFHRLAVLTVTLPPLRERGADILFLAEHFLARAVADYGLPAPSLSPDARRCLLNHDWPGNVRELANLMERVALLSDVRLITASELGLDSAASTTQPPTPPRAAAVPSLGNAMADHVRRALGASGGNISRAAAALGIARNTLRAHIKKLGIQEAGGAARGTSRGRRRQTDVVPGGTDQTPTVPALQRPPSGPSPLQWVRRTVAVLRARLARSADAPEPRDSSRGLELILDKVRSFGGRVEELGQTSVTAVFGLERIEEATRCAAHSGLAIQTAFARAISEGRGDLVVRVGIHTLPTLVGHAGETACINAEDRQEAWAALDGLVDAAGPGKVVVSATTAVFLERRFDLVALPAGGGPRAYLLAGRERTRPGRPGGSRDLVGRRQELDILDNSWAEARQKRGQVVGIVGEPGVGKSRLLGEFLRKLEAGPGRVFETAALPHAETLPYFPVRELLRAYFQLESSEGWNEAHEKVRGRLVVLDERLLACLPAIRALLGFADDDTAWTELDPPRRRQETFEAIRRLLLAEMRRQPLALVFEDAHWIDSESQALLDALVAMLPTMPVLLLITYRPEYRHRWGDASYYSQLGIRPLSPDHARELLRGLLGDDASLEPLTRHLIDWTEGNPFFLEESVRALAEVGALRGEPGQYRVAIPVSSVPVPQTVEEVLAARMERLAPGQRRVLDAAAVVGRRLPLSLLAAVSDVPEEVLRQDLEHLRAVELLYQTDVAPEAVFIFKHALVHEVAYARLAPGLRRRLHARAVDALEAREPSTETVEWLGHHARQGGLWAKAVRYLQETGVQAAGRAANREAVVAFEHALEALAHLPADRASAERGIELRLQLKNALTHMGAYDRVLAPLREAERLAQEIDDPVRLGRILAFTCDGYRLTGDFEQAIAEGRRSLTLAQQHGDLALSVMAHTYLGMALHARGAYLEAIQLFRRNVEALSGERVTMRVDMAGFPSVHSRAWLVRCLAETGEFDEGSALGTEALAIAERSEHPLNLAMAAAGLGRLHLRRGMVPAAVALLERGLDACRRWDLALWLPALAEDLGLAYVWSGRTDEAVMLLEFAVERGAGLRASHALRLAYLGEAYLRAGRDKDARAAASSALDLARGSGQRGQEAWALRLQAEIGAHFEGLGGDRIVALYEQALCLADELGMRPLAARCLLGLGRALERQGDLRAAACFERATILMRSMGMSGTLDITGSTLGDPRS